MEDNKKQMIRNVLNRLWEQGKNRGVSNEIIRPYNATREGTLIDTALDEIERIIGDRVERVV